MVTVLDIPFPFVTGSSSEGLYRFKTSDLSDLNRTNPQKVNPQIFVSDLMKEAKQAS
jgi:hypothetical protein